MEANLHTYEERSRRDGGIVLSRAETGRSPIEQNTMTQMIFVHVIGSATVSCGNLEIVDVDA